MAGAKRDWSTLRRATWTAVLAGLCCASAQAQHERDAAIARDASQPSAAEDAAESQRLRVAVAGSAPFVIRNDARDPLRGVSLDVWRAIEPKLGSDAKSELVPYDSIDQALLAVREGRADVAIGPISITAERAQRVTFTQPYFRSTLSILAPVSQSLWQKLKPFASRAFLVGVSLLLVVLLGVGVLLWLCERRANPEQFPRAPIDGIGSGVWLALVTMTTVGYGDLVPRTRAGRFVAGGWMIVAMLTASSLTASIATALTLSQLETPGISSAADLKGKAIAASTPSPSATFIEEKGGHVVRVSDVQNGIEEVKSGRASALVWDRPVLAHRLQQHPEPQLSLSRSEYEPRGYGFAVAKDDLSMLRALDVAVLALQESGGLKRIRQRWFDE